jgi:GMP synthase (glutamine-hydrolysing)
MSKLFIIKTGTTFPNTARQYGDFDAWTRNGLKIDHSEICVVDAENGAVLPRVEECGGVIVTGSHAMVTDRLSWSINIEDWIPSLVKNEIPLLGICYGHQLLARAMGGKVGFHPCGKEIGTVDIRLLPESSADPLLCSLPPQIPAHVTHSQTVLSLPSDAVRLAANSFEPNHAFRLGTCAWGVQFHPEYDAAIMKSYISEQADELEATGRDVSDLLRKVKEAPAASGLLRRFAQIVEKRRQAT